ncbi:MAG TPA: hypothetical protein VF412_15475 [Bdellovibrio sp.]|uniref:hypothetical protein n=1 Tax=Bdellovibrio sp. TaxID=28201 RepID=UPI002EEDDA3D
MTPQKLDFIFPFIVFFYGLFMVFVLENPYLARVGQERMGEAFANLSRHKNLGWMCFFVGGLWAAQNIWYSSL